MKTWKLLPLILMAGCSTVDSESSGPVAGSPEWFQSASRQEMASYFRGQCMALGVMVGTPDMAECIQTQATTHKQPDVARSAAVAASTVWN